MSLQLAEFTAKASRDPLTLDRHALMQALDEKGMLLIRGYDITLPNFETLTRMLCDRFHMPSIRANLRQEGDGHSAKVSHLNFVLFGHTEGTFMPIASPPTTCFFLCRVPPSAAGGETTITDGAEFLKRLPDDLRDRFAKAGVMYEMLWEEPRWRAEFDVETPDELLVALKKYPNTRYTFENNKLHLFYTTAAITACRQGMPVFATGMLAHLSQVNHPRYAGIYAYCNPTNGVYFGDGEKLSDADANRLIDIYDDIAHPHRWQANDLLVIDNTRFLHGRTIAKADCERVLVSRFGWLKAA